MRIQHLVFASVLAAGLALPFSGGIAAEEESKPTPPKSFALRYVPPLTNVGAPAPSARLGGATRGPTETTPTLLALVPEHVGQASTSQPRIFWFLSAGTPAAVHVVISDEDADEPLLEVEIPGPVDAGIHSISLAERGVKLEPGTLYEWFVSLAGAGAGAADDVVAGGALRVVPPEGEVAKQIAEASNVAAALAANGYWYDALARTEGAARAELLDQVGLALAAEHARR